MKIIDEKGRLFGRINLIDFLAVLFLVSLLPMLYFGYRFLTAKESEAKKEFVNIELDCRLIRLTPELLKNISAGDKEVSKDNETIGEIIRIGQSEVFKYEFDIGAGQKIIKEDPALRQVEARLKLKTELRQNRLYYKGFLIEIDSPFEFIVKDIPIYAVPTKVGAKGRAIDLYVALKDLDDDVLAKIAVGDKESDEHGNTIAEIIILGKIEPSYFDVDLGKNNFTLAEISAKKQISAKLRLQCQIKNENQLYFKNKKLEENMPFEFKTDKYKAIAYVSRTFEQVSPMQKKWVRLQVKFSGVIPEIAKIVKEADIESDPYGDIAARIVSVISNKPAQVLALKGAVLVTDVGEGNQFINLNHPFNKDILVVLDVLCINKEGILYFKNYPVKMGNNISFSTDLYSLNGEIRGMEIK